MSFKKTNRTIHKWVSIIIALPLLVSFVTGILLLVKKEVSAIQPPTMKGLHTQPSISFDKILFAAKSVELADIETWQDINRLDVRPSKGIIKIRSNNSIEIQIDASTAQVLHVAQRNSDLIESIHDGTFFEKNANLWLMLPVAIASVVISITGIIMFFLPYINKRKKKQKKH